MKASPALQLLSLNLRDVIRIASDPNTPTAQATFARHDCQTFWQKFVREVRAIEGAAELRRLMEHAANRPQPCRTYQRDGCWYYLGGY